METFDTFSNKKCSPREVASATVRRMRIVSGKFRGRRLFAPKGTATRPTSDRVREALFSILFDVEDLEVLDLYAGTGAIGIEALSRGAKRAVFVEQAAPALAVLERNLHGIGLTPPVAEVLRLPVERALDLLARKQRRFDLVFADPPYREAATCLPPVLEAVEPLLSPGGTIVLELPSTEAPPCPPPSRRAPARLQLKRTKHYGEAALAFYEQSEDDAQPKDPTMQLVNRTKAIVPSATLTLAEKAKELAQAGKDVVNLTAGEPDFDTPEHVQRAIVDALAKGYTRYTAVNGIAELRGAISKQLEGQGLSYSKEEIIVSSGAKQSLMNAILCLIEEGTEAIIPAPFWLSYVDMVKLAGGKPVIVETTEEADFLMTAEQLEAAITPATRLLFINSPSNPSGAVYPESRLAELAQVLKRHPEVTVVSDEIYDCFVFEGARATSILRVAPELKDRAVVINGCSKRYAMTGLRIGWAAAPKALVSAMSRIQGQMTSNACSIAQYGALAALTGDQGCVEVMREAYDTRRKFVMGRLAGIPGVRCFDPRGAFYVLPNLSSFVGRKLPDGSVVEDAFSIAGHLLHDHGLVVVPGGPFGVKNHIRMSIATDLDTLGRGLDRLRTALVGIQ